MFVICYNTIPLQTDIDDYINSNAASTSQLSVVSSTDHRLDSSCLTLEKLVIIMDKETCIYFFHQKVVVQ